MTTVGYGDYSPQTGAARVLMFFCMSAHLFSLGAPQTAKLARPWALATPRLAISEVFDEPRRRVSWGLLEVPPIGVLRDVSSKKPRRCMIAGLTVLAMPLAIVGSSFQEDIAHNLMTIPDMLERGDDIVAVVGSLPHIHLGCCLRNIRGGKQGCECPQDRTTCECASCPMLDDQGNYIMATLKVYVGEGE